MPFRTGIALVLLAVTLAAGHAVSASAAAPAAGPSAAAAAQPEKVNLNTATKEALLAVPGIGPRMAPAIVELRARKGGFQRLEELLEVRGIGEKSLRELARYLVVPAAAQAPPAAPAVSAASAAAR